MSEPVRAVDGSSSRRTHPDDDCPGPMSLQTPDEYKYRRLGGSLLERNSIQFEVAANSDAHIALGTYYDHYEIVLGGWANTNSVIRAKNQGPPLCSCPGKALSTPTPEKFWASWNAGGDGCLTIGRGWDFGKHVMMSVALSPRNYLIKSMYVSTGFGSTGAWTLRERPQVIPVATPVSVSVVPVQDPAKFMPVYEPAVPQHQQQPQPLLMQPQYQQQPIIMQPQDRQVPMMVQPQYQQQPVMVQQQYQHQPVIMQPQYQQQSRQVPMMVQPQYQHQPVMMPQYQQQYQRQPMTMMPHYQQQQPMMMMQQQYQHQQPMVMVPR